MNIKEYENIKNEIRSLREILENTPIENVIDQREIKYLIEEKETLIKDIDPNLFPKKTSITFRGLPVDGTHSINAEFGANALNKFCEAIHTITASSNVKNKGPIPQKEMSEIRIVGVAIGSFGFDLELPVPIDTKKADNETENWFPLENKAIKAIDEIQNLFDIASTKSDDELNSVLSNINLRAKNKIYEFTNYLKDNEAYCNIDLKGGKKFTFESLEKLVKVNERLNPKNVIETMEDFFGEFQGELPTSRNFEFKTNEGVIIKGKIGMDIKEPQKLDGFLHKKVAVKFQKIQTGQSSPTYTLLKLEDIDLLEDRTISFLDKLQ